MELHNERCNRTRTHFFGRQPELRIDWHLSVPDHLKSETLKFTVTYAIEIVNVEYVIYRIRPIRSLRMITDDTIEYEFKYADRSKLGLLTQKRDYFDDILIIKNGFITDISYANIIFLLEKRWYSPERPLLSGTRLRSYLEQGRITPAPLRPEDLSSFSEARMINAMVSIEQSPVIPIGEIRF